MSGSTRGSTANSDKSEREHAAQRGPPLPRLKKTKELLHERVFPKDLNLGPKLENPWPKGVPPCQICQGRKRQSSV